MIYDTLSKLQRRKDELEAQDIARIKRWKDKTKAAFFLQAKYGIDCDLSPFDAGEPPKYAT